VGLRQNPVVPLDPASCLIVIFLWLKADLKSAPAGRWDFK
jgi:hypothetical protein